MKNLTVYWIVGLLQCAFSVSAQQYMDTHNPREIKSILNKENDITGFGGADLKITEIKEERTLITGGYGSILINRHYYFGLAAYGIATNTEFDGFLPDDTPKRLNITGGYAGIFLGGTILAKEIVHLSIPIVLGAGSIQVTDKNFFPDSNGDAEFIIDRSSFFVAEPGAELEFNITRTFRIAVGTSYRFVRALELSNLTDDDFTNWSAILSLRAGRF